MAVFLGGRKGLVLEMEMEQAAVTTINGKAPLHSADQYGRNSQMASRRHQRALRCPVPLVAPRWRKQDHPQGPRLLSGTAEE